MFKVTKKTKGEQFEVIARKYLEQQGLICVTSNFRCRRGEIDLIMKDQCQLIFIEVRYRSRNNYGTAADTVTRKKQSKIILAAQYYLHKYYLTEKVSCRFDIVAIDSIIEDQGREIKWLKDAFNL